MVVVHHHAGLGLPVVVQHGGLQVLGKPAGDLRIQRFAGAADHAQLSLDAGTGGGAGSNDLPVRGGRTGQVGHPQLADDGVQAVHAEAGFAEGGGVAQQQRADHRVVQAVGPSGVGDVPEHIVGSQVDGQFHVAGKRHHRAQRHGHTLGAAGGAGGGKQGHQRIALQQHRLQRRRGRHRSRMPVDVTVAQCVAGGQHRGHRRAGIEFVQLAAVCAVGHQQPGVAGLQAAFNGLGAERGEQRLVYRPQAPGAEDGGQQVRRTRQQAGHHIARADAGGTQHLCGAGGGIAQVVEGVKVQGALRIDPAQGQPIASAVPVAAFHAGVDALVQAPLEAVLPLRDIEAVAGLLVGRAYCGLRGHARLRRVSA